MNKSRIKSFFNVVCSPKLPPCYKVITIFVMLIIFLNTLSTHDSIYFKEYN